jgi:8-oxo-dGTP pyrophosphatase MutT (NUDIX family)
MLMVENIKSKLLTELPGRKAQYLMAPSDRTIRDFGVKPNELKKSAVLCLLYYKNNDLYVLLTQRAYYKGPHGGQISFPGGKFEIEKDSNLEDTAKRETFEEIQLSQDKFEILGSLSPLKIPVSKALVQPFLAFSEDISTAVVDGYEAIDLYEIPIPHLLDKSNIKWYNTEAFEYPYFDFDGKKIWGATAMILSEILEILKELD